MIEDKYGENLRKNDTVVFLRGKIMILGTIQSINGFQIVVLDEQEPESTYKIKSHKVVKFSGKWKTKAGEDE